MVRKTAEFTGKQQQDELTVAKKCLVRDGLVTLDAQQTAAVRAVGLVSKVPIPGDRCELGYKSR
jgi:hypothetical protein